jgi:hypothetical protein
MIMAGPQLRPNEHQARTLKCGFRAWAGWVGGHGNYRHFAGFSAMYCAMRPYSPPCLRIT